MQYKDSSCRARKYTMLTSCNENKHHHNRDSKQYIFHKYMDQNYVSKHKYKFNSVSAIYVPQKNFCSVLESLKPTTLLSQICIAKSKGLRCNKTICYNDRVEETGTDGYQNYYW